jgi:hypothetical protein
MNGHRFIAVISRTHVITGPPSAERGWSLYGAPGLQPTPISGKSTRPVKRKNKPNPLPPVATGCLRRSMVRRGSTVRVRQRASQNASKWPFLLPQTTRSGQAAAENLSPRSAPKFMSGTRYRLEQRAAGAQSTSVRGRGSIVLPSERLPRSARDGPFGNAGVSTLAQAAACRRTDSTRICERIPSIKSVVLILALAASTAALLPSSADALHRHSPACAASAVQYRTAKGCGVPKLASCLQIADFSRRASSLCTPNA